MLFILNPIVMMFIVARFILGFANAFCIVAASTLIGGTAKGIKLEYWSLTYAKNSHIQRSERSWAAFSIPLTTSVN